MRFVSVLVLAAGVLVGVSGCDRPKVVAATCRADSDCQNGSFCENYECVSRETKACDVVTDGNPILQPTPHTLDFGTVDTQAALLQTVTLHNIGNCTLTLFEATLADPATGFVCDLCDAPDRFPIEIWPGRSIELTVSYSPTAVRDARTELNLLSDDREYPTLRVPIRANYIGTPALLASPSPVDFGYTPQGLFTRRSVNLTNTGTGNAPIEITSIALSPVDTMDFALVTPMELPRALKPVTVDKTAIQNLEVRYTPRSLADHAADLVITTNKGSYTVPLKGTSASLPKIKVDEGEINLGDVTLGTSNFVTLTIVNEGGAPLTVSPKWGGSMFTTDFSTNPQVIPDVLPTKYVEVQVQVTATREGALSAILTLETNDPQKPTVNIPVRARGVIGAGEEVVKIEMTYGNGADNTFDNDLRNVDLTLEHPYGYVCNKGTPNPMNWGNYGNASWLAFAPKEEPERIILADSRQDGTYRVMVNYKEDCASAPTTLLAGVLGISVEALIAYLSGGLVPVGGGDIGNAISTVCLDHSSTTTTVKVYVNGNLVAERNAPLGRKGDTAYVLNLVRQGGSFSVP